MRELEERDTEFLIRKPESGIGYQILSVELPFREDPLIAVAFNAEFLVANPRELIEPTVEYEDVLEGQSLVEAEPPAPYEIPEG